ncbi:MAG: hypothetical protein LBT18_03970, partial [Endomicrobium sp.]|nr:hypothetical protein [Endomicrobium sp.]
INNNVELIEDEEEFNRLLVDYLVYYNSKRAHLSLNLKTPLEIMFQIPEMSHIYVTKYKILKKLIYFV